MPSILGYRMHLTSLDAKIELLFLSRIDRTRYCQKMFHKIEYFMMQRMLHLGCTILRVEIPLIWKRDSRKS